MGGSVLELAGNASAPGRTLELADERALIRRAQRGDRNAFDDLVRMYDQKVLRMAMRFVRTPEDARDLYQESFLKVYRALPRFRFESSFSTWLYRIVTNASMDYLRRQKSRKEQMVPDRPGLGADEFFQSVADARPGQDPERAMESRRIQQRILSALASLNPRERMVFELRHYQGLKLRLIGEMCGTTEETAKNCLFRATRKLRMHLEDLVR